MVDVCVLGASKSLLLEALVRDLDPRTHQGGDDVVFNFSIRVRHAATSDDVEDAAPWRPAAACRTPGGGSVSSWSSTPSLRFMPLFPVRRQFQLHWTRSVGGCARMSHRGAFVDH